VCYCTLQEHICPLSQDTSLSLYSHLFCPFSYVELTFRKSLATNFFGPFPQEIACHKTFSAHFLRKSLATNFFGSFPQEIGRHKTFSAKSLRKSTATSEKEGIEDGPQENGIFFGLLRDIVEILFACYRNGSIFAAVSWHM